MHVFFSYQSELACICSDYLNITNTPQAELCGLFCLIAFWHFSLLCSSRYSETPLLFVTTGKRFFILYLSTKAVLSLSPLLKSETSQKLWLRRWSRSSPSQKVWGQSACCIRAVKHLDWFVEKCSASIYVHKYTMMVLPKIFSISPV